MDKKNSRFPLHAAENSMREKTASCGSGFAWSTQRIFRLKQAMLHRLLFLFLTLFLSQLAITASAQGSSGNQAIGVKWKLDATIDGVQFYHAVAECNGNKVALLKFNNTNNYKVEVSWKEVFTTPANSRQEGFSGKKSLVLPPGELSETNCKSAATKGLLISSGDINPTSVVVMQKFEYKDIAVSKVK